MATEMIEKTPGIDGMTERKDLEEEKDKRKHTEVAEKTEMKTMASRELTDSAKEEEEAITTAGREVVHEETARRLQAKGSLL